MSNQYVDLPENVATIVGPVTISGTVTANLGTIDGAATAANQTTQEATLTAIQANQTNGTQVTNITGTVPLPTGASTSALQTAGNASLSSIDSKLTSPITVTGPLTDTQLRASAVPVSAATLPLPSGAATSANQATEIASLASIDSKLTSPITVTGPLTDTQLRATPVPISGTVTANAGSGTFAVSDSTTHTELTTINTTLGTPMQQTGGSVTANAGTNLNTSALALESGGNLAALNAKFNSLGQKTMANSAPVVIASDQSAIAVTGTVTTTNSANGATGAAVPAQATQVAGSDGTNLRALKVSATGVLSVDGSATTQPVSGTVTSNIGTTNGLALDATLTNSSQVTKLVDTAGTNQASISAAGALKVDGSATTQPVSGTVTANAGTGNFTVTQGTAANLNATVSIAAAQTLATVTTVSAVTAITNALPAGTNNIGKVNSLATTPTAGTLTQAALSVGTTAIRLTVTGSAPSATRSVLMAIADSASTAKFYIGSSSVTNSGANRGLQILAGQPFVANSDAGDYYIISDTAAQTVYVTEQA